MPCRTVGELVLFEQQNIFLAILREPVRDAATDDPSADDDDSGACRNSRHRDKVSCWRFADAICAGCAVRSAISHESRIGPMGGVL